MDKKSRRSCDFTAPYPTRVHSYARGLGKCAVV